MMSERSSSEPGGGASDDRSFYESYMPLVKRVSMRLARQLPPTITLDDVLSVGWLGLMEAAQRRTPTMSHEEFEAYASHRVRGAVLDYLRSLDPMSRRMRGASRKITQSIKALTGSLGRPPEEQEIAGDLGIDLETYRELLVEIAQSDTTRIELTDLAVPPASPDAGPESIVSRREILAAVAEAITKLPERLQLVMGLYYQEECNLREIGEIMGVTESRVCQLHSEALHRIRAQVEPPETIPQAPASGTRRTA